MLSWAGRRQTGFRRLRVRYEQLALPWLCPALLRPHRRQIQTRLTATSATASPIAPSERSHRRFPSRQPTRQYATAIAEQHDHQNIYVPFEGQDASPGSPPFLPSLDSGLPLHPPGSRDLSRTSSVIILKDYPCSRPKAVRRSNGIGGDMDEMLANLDVSLSVGMFDRAALLINRMSVGYARDSQEVRDLHNKYIDGIVNYMVVNRRPDMVSKALKWFEVDMQPAGVRPDATTYALLLKMTLRMLHGHRLQRTVDRYWRMVADAGAEEAVISSPVFSTADLGLLSETSFAQQPSASPEIPETQKPSTSAQPDTSSQEQSTETARNRNVRGTHQKGLGLSTLKQMLSSFEKSAETSPQPELESDTPEERKQETARLRQQILEENSVAAAVERWRKESESRIAAGVPIGADKKLGALLYEWHQELSSKIQYELDQADASTDKGKLTAEDQARCEQAPYLKAVGSHKLAAITIMSVLNTMSKSGIDKGVALAQVVGAVGNAVEEEYLGERLRRTLVEKRNDGEKAAKRFHKFLEKSMTSGQGRANWRRRLINFKQKEEPIKWSGALEAKLGAHLCSLFFRSATVPVKRVNSETKQKVVNVEPAFRHLRQLNRGRPVGYVHAHEKITRRLRSEPPGVLLAKHLPMLSPPREWKAQYDGGFLGHPTDVVRVKDGDENQQRYVKAASDRGDLKDVYAGLSVLGKTGWKINKTVYDTMLQAWNSGEEIANFAPDNPDLPEPQKPETANPDELRAYYRAKQSVQNKRSAYHSQRCFQNFQMEIATAYLDETFFLPHNLDFRGRAYPLPPYLNQMGADNCRGLLLFSKGKELGQNGLGWLKVHLANVFGYDKASLDGRGQFVMDNLNDIFDSAENPLNGQRWWLKAEDPFQCLAACIELKNALDSPDPTQYVSHLPIHQDGSCNGLQHYAALGGDIVGAQQVNLEPSDKPSDIYTAVSEHVKASIREDASKDDKIAVVLQDKITRKVVKQTVMTNVYGVTFIGAMRQVKRQLKDFYPQLEKAGILIVCSTYISRKIFDALRSMFTGAHGIQFWLGDCANRITQSLSFDQLEAMKVQYEALEEDGDKERKKPTRKSKGHSDSTPKLSTTVIWTTPMGMPVVQPYRDAHVRRIPTSIQELAIKDPRLTDLVSRRKQLQAFPPNFIHSLDATHMFLSAIKCDELGLTFSAVHDSFWTHASDVDTMNRVLRDAFVRMHSDDIVRRLDLEFKTRYSNHIYLAKLHSGSALAKRIKSHRRTTGRDPTHELLEEYKRLKLLSSDDPAEQELGRQMVTPGSIFADEQNAEESLTSVQSLGVAGIGHVSQEEAEAAKQEGSSDNSDALAGSNGATADAAPHLDSQLEGANAEELALARAAESSQKIAGKKSQQKRKDQSVAVWLPISFLPVPPKGDFDITRLKSSDYFFS